MPHAFSRTGSAVLFAAAALLSATAFAAPPGVPAAVVVSSAQPQVQVMGQATRTMTSAEFAEVRGEYRLSSGGSLVLGGARHRPVAELNDRASQPLLSVAPNQLVSADGKLRLEFRTHANGEVSGLTLHVTPDLL